MAIKFRGASGVWTMWCCSFSSRVPHHAFSWVFGYPSEPSEQEPNTTVPTLFLTTSVSLPTIFTLSLFTVTRATQAGAM